MHYEMALKKDDKGQAFPIPESIDHGDLMRALEPLCDLLRITPQHFYEIPGMQIGLERVTFVVPSPEKPEEWSKDRPTSRRAEIDTQGLGIAELAQVVSVKVVR